MGSELLSDAYPTEPKDAQSSKTDSEIYREMCPFYLSIGMSSAEYWDGDPSLPRYYRKAYLLKQEQANQQAWIQGLYFYNAFGAIMSQMFPDKGNKSKTYIEKPIDFHKKDFVQEQEPVDEEKEAKLAEIWMNRLCRNYKHVGES